MTENKDKDMEELSNEEEILMDLYEKETGKNPITARKTIRKEYLKWKSEGLQEDPTKEIIKKSKKLVKMNVKERMTKQAEKLIDVSIKSMQECADYYPKHIKIVSKLVSIFMDLIMFDKYDLIKFHDYLEEFSNYISKKYFSDEINKLWRKPIVLEKEVMKYLFWEKNNIWSNEKKTMFNESMSGFLEEHGLIPEIHFGEEFYNAEQTARLLGISIEELDKFTEELHHKLKGHILRVKKRKEGYSIILDSDDLELNLGEGIQEVKEIKKTGNLKNWLRKEV